MCIFSRLSTFQAEFMFVCLLCCLDDGDEDIIVANNPGRPEIFRNDGGNKNNWIKVRALHVYVMAVCLFH